jgi:membrane-associated phospholipid phosphatase
MEILNLLKNKEYSIKLFVSVFILIIAMTLIKIMGFYAEVQPAMPNGDVLHDLLPTYNLNFLATIGFLASMTILILYFIIKEPIMLPVFAVTMALFKVTRGFFFSITHLGAPAIRIDDHAIMGLFSPYYLTKDLFPSGHVAVPFLAYLFVKDKKLKKFFLLMSVIMAVTVLLMKVHYSIDVFGAYFIAFGLFHFSKTYIWKFFLLKTKNLNKLISIN